MEGTGRSEGQTLRFNQRKRQALAIFEWHGWLNPPAWAALASFYPVRAAYSYLVRLHRWGLLERRRDVRGMVLYRLSLRGKRRLAWLESTGIPDKGYSREWGP